jgi:tetratricopeptide (TPR) repeat protein
MNTLNNCWRRNAEACARRGAAVLAAAVLLGSGGSGRAQSPSVDDLPEKPAYVEMLRGDQQRERGDAEKAAAHYREAIQHFQTLLEAQPDYKTETLQFRMEYCRRQLALLRGDDPDRPLPTPRTPPPAPVASTATTRPPRPPTPAAPSRADAEVEALRSERDRLREEYTALAARETEALAEAERQTTQMRQAMELLRADLDRREQESAADRQAREDLSAQIAALEQTQTVRAAEREALAAERDALASARTDLEEELRRALEQHERLRDDLALAGQRLIEAETLERRLTEQLRAAEVRAREIERERDELRTAATSAAEAAPADTDRGEELRAALRRAEEAETAQKDALARSADMERQLTAAADERAILAQRIVLLEREAAAATDAPVVTPEPPTAVATDEPAGDAMVELRTAAAAGRRAALRRIAPRLAADDSVSVDHLREAGRLLLQAGEANAATLVLTRAVERMPDHVGALEDLAQAAYRLGRAEEAIGYYDRVALINPQHGRTQFNLAVLRASVRPPQMDAARRHYETARALGEPRDEALERTLAR